MDVIGEVKISFGFSDLKGLLVKGSIRRSRWPFVGLERPFSVLSCGVDQQLAV